MKTNTILRSIVLTVLAAFAGTAFFSSCSREEPVTTDEPAQVEEPVQNTIHVTLNAQMADDASTRATYGYEAVNAADRKVTIEYGDQLYVRVKGTADAWDYYGVLSNTAEAPNTFSGELTCISGTYSGTDIITESKGVAATLMPIGYGSNGFMTVRGDGTLSIDYTNAFADGAFSGSVPLVSENLYSIYNAAGSEKTVTLSLNGAVLCFTISGLSAGNHNVSLNDGNSTVTGTTNANGSGVATFSIGYDDTRANTFTLSIDGYEPINLGTKTLTAGHLYKISRTAAPVGAIPGKFSVSSTKQVYFAKGNLQAVIGGGPTATYNYTASSWKFADHQYDFIGNAAGNTTFAVGSTVDLFGWVGASATYDTYGLCTYTTVNNEYYGTSNTESLKTDWGSIPGVVSALGSGWHTLTSAEWTYVLESRASGATVNSTTNARYTYATVNTDGTGVRGIILFPDGVTFAAGEATWGEIIGDGYDPMAHMHDPEYEPTPTTCTTAQWTALEAKGCVFLPAAGYRSNMWVDGVDGYTAYAYGRYWSSTPYSSDVWDALRVSFTASRRLSTATEGRRWYGSSVRLVRDAN